MPCSCPAAERELPSLPQVHLTTFRLALPVTLELKDRPTFSTLPARRMRIALKASLKRALKQAGLFVSRTSRFGIDANHDIHHLAEKWGVPISVFVDVGANTGDTAVKAREDFPQAKIYSFEPHPETFAQLNARIRDLKNIETVNLALSDRKGNTELYVYDRSLINSLVPDATFAVLHNEEARTIEVPRDTLGNFCSENGIDEISVLKIDTEGYDLVVLKGAVDLLSRQCIHFIFVEFNHLQRRPGVTGGSLFEIDSFLAPFGYRFIASYNDYIETNAELFSVSNALFAHPPI